jgi:multiple sugar transport system permease protein
LATPVLTPGPPASHVETPIVGRHDVNRRRLARLGWRFTLPALIVVAAVTIFPIVYSLIMSLRHVNETGSGFQFSGFGFFNYTKIWKLAEFRYALFFTLLFTLISVSVEIALGMGVALILQRLIKGRGIMMAILLVPWSVITVISAQLWKYMYDPSFGVITKILHGLGLGNVQILGAGSVSTISALIVADVWKTTPFVSIILLAGLVMLPEDVYEAAEVDGASEWTAFWKITLPLLRPTVALAILFRILQAFGLFDLPWVMTQGAGGHSGYATTSLAVLSYEAIGVSDFGVSSAIATTTALLVVIGCLCFYRVFKNQTTEES